MFRECLRNFNTMTAWKSLSLFFGWFARIWLTTYICSLCSIETHLITNWDGNIECTITKQEGFQTKLFFDITRVTNRSSPSLPILAITSNINTTCEVTKALKQLSNFVSRPTHLCCQISIKMKHQLVWAITDCTLGICDCTVVGVDVQRCSCLWRS